MFILYQAENMSEEQLSATNPEETQDAKGVPIGIVRLRKEWGAETTDSDKRESEVHEEVVFPEVDGGAGVGDYELTLDDLRSQLALSDEAVERLVSVGELDSILVRGEDGEIRRLMSRASIQRFLTDSLIDPNAVTKAAEAIADREIAQAIDDVRVEVRELRNTQSKILQQMKDILLLEVRNLKEQDRDLASFVYELSQKIDNLERRKK